MTDQALLCPICQVPLPKGATTCPDCCEDLSALLYLKNRSAVLYNKGLELAHAGEISRAILALLEAVEIDPTSVPALTVLGKLYAQRGRRAEAQTIFEQALALAPDQADAAEGLARLRQLSEAESEAEAERAAAQMHTDRARRRRRLAEVIGAFCAGALALLLVWSMWPRQPAPVVVQAVTVVVLPTVNLTSVSTLAPTPLLPTSTSLPQPTKTPTQPPSPTSGPTATPTYTPIPLPTPTPLPDLVSPVRAALSADSRLQKLPIQVEQDGTMVRLIGTAPSLVARYLAEQAAQKVPGVSIVDLRQLAIVPTYTVQREDNLWKIAQKVYGDAELWPRLAKANGVEPPYTIYVGQVLNLPDLTGSE